MLSIPSRAVVAAAMTAALCMSGCVELAGFRSKGQQTITARHVPDAALHVANENGSVSVNADEAAGQVTVIASITAMGDTQEEADERLAGVEIVAERLPDGVLSVRSVFPGGRRPSDSCALEISLPDLNGVTVETSNGGVTLTGLGGDADVHTSNGSVRVRDQGGSARIRTSNGRIEVIDAAGAIDARSSNGSVEIAGMADAATVETSNGRVTCRAAGSAAGPIRIKTSNGSVSLTVPAGLGGVITASTSNGSVTVHGPSAAVEGSKTRRTIRLSGPGSESSIETSNGGVSVTIEETPADQPRR
ncbi:MAG: hypothetical protein IT430_12355 [Phycisphaerales bacterium]|nr:hypothetical protein [Phycisphaerales bacterium]